ncbi:MAG: WD40 repeat protein [Verrucomicrobiales bacterium]|jgi:WD40 repeat protein
MSPDKITIKEATRFSRQDIVFCLKREGETEQFYFGSSDSKVHHIDLAAEKPESTTFEGGGHSSYVTGLARVGGQLVSSSYDRHLCWWNAETRTLVRKIPAHDKWIRGVVASPDQKIVASVADDMVCKIWNAESGDLIRELGGHEPFTPNDYPSMLFACAFSPNGQMLATADKVGHIVIWDLATGDQVKTLEAPTMYTWDPKQRRHSIGGVRSLAFSPDGKILAAGGMGQVGNIDHLGAKARVRVFDWEAGETLAEIETSKAKGLVEQLYWRPDGGVLFGFGGDNKGMSIVINPVGWKVEHEAVSSTHIHDFVINAAHDKVFTAGHNQLAVLELTEIAE